MSAPGFGNLDLQRAALVEGAGNGLKRTELGRKFRVFILLPYLMAYICIYDIFHKVIFKVRMGG